jgi:MoaA/NifB/PqqE/SkfB family radical SAM enzyme
LFVSWQITRDCDLACLHCCTESAPGKRLPDELDLEETMKVAREIVRNEVPYVMLCGGEPLVAPHFFELAEALGGAGIQLKIETNGQRFDDAAAERLARLPVRSIQVSLDADTQEVYERQRPGGSLARAHAACRAVRAAGMPLEVTFAPTRLNLHEAPAVIRRARELGAFRFNSGQLMRVGTAARHWQRLAPPPEAWGEFRALLAREAADGDMELCFEPFSLADGLRRSAQEPPATLLVLPNGWVKVAAAIPSICADLRRCTLAEAWGAYQRAWHEPAVEQAVGEALSDESRHRLANTWQPLNLASA